MKTIKLTDKEIKRADEACNGRKYTIATRPYLCGKIFVAVVWLDTEEIHDFTLVDTREEIHYGIKSMLRWMDKMGVGGNMADASRSR